MVTSLFKRRRKRLISLLEEELEAVPSGVGVGGGREEALTREPFLVG